jgi:hypothetical protein
MASFETFDNSAGQRSCPRPIQITGVEPPSIGMIAPVT